MSLTSFISSKDIPKIGPCPTENPENIHFEGNIVATRAYDGSIFGVETLGELVKAERRRRGWSQSHLGRLIELDGQSISNLELGHTKTLKLKSLPKLADAIGVPIERIMKLVPGNHDVDTNGESGIDPRPVTTPVTPTWDIDLRASVWAEAPICELRYDDPDQRCVIDTGRFRLRILGTCMEPEYADGSVIEFQVIRWDRQPLEIGRDYVVCKSDGTATFKQLRAIGEEELTFSARNQKDYPGEIVVARQEIARMAEVAHRLAPAAEPVLPRLRPKKKE